MKPAQALSTFYVRHTGKACCGVYLIFIIITLITLRMNLLSIDEIVLEHWLVTEEQVVEKYDALEASRTVIDANKVVSQGKTDTLTETSGIVALQFLYKLNEESDEESILTPKNIQDICNLENNIYTYEDYDKICQIDTTTGDCAIPSFSVTNLFYIDDEYTIDLDRKNDCELLSDDEFNEKLNEIFTVMRDDDPQVDSSVYLKSNFLEIIQNFYAYIGIAQFSIPLHNANATLNDDNVVYARSYISLGSPLDGYDNPLASTSGEQFNAYLAYHVEMSETIQKYLNLVGSFGNSQFNSNLKDAYINLYDIDNTINNNIVLKYWSFPLESNESATIVVTDILVAGFAIVFVAVAVFIYTKSPFYTLIGISSIGLSIPVGLFIYKIIFNIPYFTNIHIVAIFIILGIGCDDFFVFIDAWKQSKGKSSWIQSYDDIEEDKESKDFDVLKINKFGTNNKYNEIEVARMIYTWKRSSGAVFNTSFTTAAAFFATGLSPITPVAGFGIYAAVLVLVNFLFLLILYPPATLLYHRYFHGKSTINVIKSFCGGKKDDNNEDDDDDDDDEHVYEPSMLELLFLKLYIPLYIGSSKKFNMKIVPIISCVIFMFLFVIMTYFTFKLETPSEEDENLGPSHMMSGFSGFYGQEFPAEDGGYSGSEIIFGISDINRDDYERFKPTENRGEPIYDENFDLSTDTAIDFLIETCENLKVATCDNVNCYDGLLIKEGTLNCFIEDFLSYHNETYPSFIDTTQVIKDLDSSTFYERLRTFSQDDSSSYKSTYTSLIGYLNDEDEKPAFVSIQFYASILGFQPVNVKEDVLKIQEEYLQTEIIDKAPTELQSAFWTSFDLIWTKTELGLVSGLYSGLIISLPIAFAVVLFSTGNIIIAIYALLTICGVVVTVLGFAYLLGWSLGIIESIAGVMVVGLSIDYSLHVAEMIVVAQHEGYKTRIEKATFAAEKMGGTITAGAITTGGAAVVMFACQLQFFSKMATLLLLTVIFSYLFTFCFFVPLNIIAGPVGDQGNIYTCCGYKKNDTIDDNSVETAKAVSTEVKEDKN